MKKLFVFVSLIGMVIGLFSCGNTASENQTTENYDVVGYDTVVFVGTVTTPDGRCLQAEDTVIRTVFINSKWESVEEPNSLSEDNQESMDRYFTTIEFPSKDTKRNWNTNYMGDDYVHTFTREGISYGCLEALLEKIEASQVKKSWEDCYDHTLDSVLLVRLYGELPKRVSEKKLEILTEWVSVETLPSFGEIIQSMNSTEAWPQKGFFPPEWGEPIEMTTLHDGVRVRSLTLY